MFVLNPDPYSLPCYRIGPFRTEDLSKNHQLPKSEFLDDYLDEKFVNREHFYTVNGREAIHLALKHYDLEKDDVVTILTTSGNFYISGCVTNEIEKFCKWSREIETRTKVLFVNHEFGYIYPEMEKLVSLDIPIIEDCCTTFFSQNRENKVGSYGDFAVYSFPKFFPIQVGGILVNNRQKPMAFPSQIEPAAKEYIRNVVSHHVKEEENLLRKRNNVFNYGIGLYSKLGFAERFERESRIVPSVMLLKNYGILSDLPELKKRLWAHGIQSSVFYGEDAFFIPSHQNLTENDIQYFFEVIKSTMEMHN